MTNTENLLTQLSVEQRMFRDVLEAWAAREGIVVEEGCANFYIMHALGLGDMLGIEPSQLDSPEAYHA